jgi:hypothetical protein
VPLWTTRQVVQRKVDELAEGAAETYGRVKCSIPRPRLRISIEAEGNHDRRLPEPRRRILPQEPLSWLANRIRASLAETPASRSTASVDSTEPVSAAQIS